jgi:hypothetical protein
MPDFEENGRGKMPEFASKPVAGTALGLSIGALGLNILGGLLGSGRGVELAGDVALTPTARVTRVELQQSERISRLETELASERAARYADVKFEAAEKMIFSQQREIDHMKAMYVPGKLVMAQSNVVDIDNAS